MQLDATQKMALSNVRMTRERVLSEKANGLARLRMELDARIAGLTRDMDVEVRKAFALGIPKRQIGIQGLGTTNPNTVYESLRRTAGEAFTPAELHTDPLANRYSVDAAGLLVVTLTDEELAQIKLTIGYDDADGIAPNAATFKLGTHANGSDTLIPTEPTLFGTTWVRNPVAEWLWANEREALAWLAENTPQEVAA